MRRYGPAPTGNEWIAYTELQAWLFTFDREKCKDTDLLIGDRDARFPFLHILSKPFDDVPIQPIATRLIERWCKHKSSHTAYRPSVCITRFRFRETAVPFASRVAYVFGRGLIELGNSHSSWKRCPTGPFNKIKSIPDIILFDPKDWDDCKLEPILYGGLRNGQGQVQTRGIAMLYGEEGVCVCILGSRLPDGVDQVPHGRILRGEIWALLHIMMRAGSLDPGMCFLLSFTETRVRVIMAKFVHGVGGGRAHLELHVASNKRLITDTDETFDPHVYWEMFGWGLFQRTKRSVPGEQCPGDDTVVAEDCDWDEDDEDDMSNSG